MANNLAVRCSVESHIHKVREFCPRLSSAVSTTDTDDAQRNLMTSQVFPFPPQPAQHGHLARPTASGKQDSLTVSEYPNLCPITWWPLALSALAPTLFCRNLDFCDLTDADLPQVDACLTQIGRDKIRWMYVATALGRRRWGDKTIHPCFDWREQG